MTGRLPFFWRRRVPPRTIPLILAPPPDAQGQTPGGVILASPLVDAPPEDQIVTAMLAALSGYLPPPTAGLPSPGVSVVSVADASVGIGNLRGIDRRGPYDVVALKGGRLEAVVRFELWGHAPGDVETAMTGLQDRLLAARDLLRTEGFLRLSAGAASLSEAVSTTALNAWRKTVNLVVLYEYHYQDSDGANSLIARIPVTVNNQFHESMVITDEMVRWDNQAATALALHGEAGRPIPVTGVGILAYLPGGWDGGGVMLAVTAGGSSRQHTYATVRAFLSSFTLDAGTVDLGGNPYVGGHLAFPNADFPDPVVLTGGADNVRISYAAPTFDSAAVVYLRLLT